MFHKFIKIKNNKILRTVSEKECNNKLIKINYLTVRFLKKKPECFDIL